MALALSSAQACGRAVTDRAPVGPDVEANLVALFHPGATVDDIDRFLEQTVFVGPARGQHRHRPGVGSILKVHVVNHEGYAVTFFSGATQLQRSTVEADMNRSPIVLKVFHNIAPDQIQPAQLLTSGP
jgi:hypothetical protein